MDTPKKKKQTVGAFTPALPTYYSSLAQQT